MSSVLASSSWVTAMNWQHRTQKDALQILLLDPPHRKISKLKLAARIQSASALEFKNGIRESRRRFRIPIPNQRIQDTLPQGGKRWNRGGEGSRLTWRAKRRSLRRRGQDDRRRRDFIRQRFLDARRRQVWLLIPYSPGVGVWPCEGKEGSGESAMRRLLGLLETVGWIRPCEAWEKAQRCGRRLLARARSRSGTRLPSSKRIYNSILKTSWFF